MEPKSYKCRFIQPGIISYDDIHQGIVLVDKTALDNMSASFRNCPVIFIPNKHDDSNKENSFNFDDLEHNPASGLVTGIPYWGDDGWQYVEFTVWDKDAINAIDKNGFSVSCAYTVTETTDGGEWHQIPYDEEITNGKYLHLAIIARPRYEGSQIFANSKGGHGIMALFGMKPKKNAIPPAAATEPAKKPAAPAAGDGHAEPDEDNKPVMVNAETEVDINGTKVPLYELVEAYSMKKGDGNMPEELQDDDQVTLADGSKVSVAELKQNYSDLSTPDNGTEGSEETPPAAPQAAPAAPEKKPAMTNSAPARVNTVLKNAARNAMPEVAHIDTEADRLERGKVLYSTPVTQGGK
jgi:hypothetical protein